MRFTVLTVAILIHVVCACGTPTTRGASTDRVEGAEPIGMCSNYGFDGVDGLECYSAADCPTGEYCLGPQGGFYGMCFNDAGYTDGAPCDGSEYTCAHGFACYDPRCTDGVCEPGDAWD